MGDIVYNSDTRIMVHQRTAQNYEELFKICRSSKYPMPSASKAFWSSSDGLCHDEGSDMPLVGLRQSELCSHGNFLPFSTWLSLN